MIFQNHRFAGYLRMKKACIFVLVSFAVYLNQGMCQGPGNSKKGMTLDDKAFLWALPKGGIGMYSNHLSVVTKSGFADRNTIYYSQEDDREGTWYGKNVASPQVVIYYRGRIWSTETPPDGFDLSNAVVISFEKDKIRIYDFASNKGFYYNRLIE